MRMQDLSGRVAIVTGASGGIGEAAARLLAEEGVQVVLAARRADRIAKLADELGDTAVAMPTDITNLAQVAALFAMVKKRFGGLDLLFNNAGVGVYGPFAESKPDDWRRMLDANVFALFSCTHTAIPLMKGRPGAMIASMSSTGGRYGLEELSVYCATKHAVVGFHEALRKELGPAGIRVTLLEPGAVWTEFGDNVSEERLHEWRTRVDALNPDDVAQSLVYAFAQHPRVMVQEILLRPVKQTLP